MSRVRLSRVSTNLDNGLHHPLDLPGLHQSVRLGPQSRQLRLVVLDPPLQIRDVVLVQTLSPVKQIPHTDQGVALPLQIFEHTLVPSTALVLHQRLARAEVPTHSHQAVVEKWHLVRVGGVQVGGRLSHRV